MSLNQPAQIHPREVLSAMSTHRKHWLLPTIALTAAAVAYAVLVTPPWEATMPMLVRDEAVGVFRRPGQFESVDALKTAQETVLELARSRAVVTSALKKIGPPEDYVAASDEPEDQWPSKKDVEKVQKLIKIQPPKGSELGKTDIFYLAVRDKVGSRAIALANAVADEIDERLQLMRDRKAKSLVEELGKTVRLARADLATATESLSAVEVQVGADLGELRILSESATGESNLRSHLNEIKTQLIETRKRQKTNHELLASLQSTKSNSQRLTAVQTELLRQQPSLQRMKDAYVDACLSSAKLRGEFSDQHPRMQGLLAAENELRHHLETETKDAIRAITADIRVAAGLIESLEQQQADVAQRMDKLAGLRATYANLAADVRHHNDILRKAVTDLSEARASQAASEIVSQLTRIDEPSIGSEPSGPSKALIMVAGVFGGLMTGFGTVLASLSMGPAPNMNPITLVPSDWVEPLREMVDKASNQPWRDAVAQVVPGRFRST